MTNDVKHFFLYLFAICIFFGGTSKSLHIFYWVSVFLLLIFEGFSVHSGYMSLSDT